jgi:hypothetical protein
MVSRRSNKKIILNSEEGCNSDSVFQYDACTLDKNRVWIPTASWSSPMHNFTLDRNRKYDQSTNLVFSDSNSELGTRIRFEFRFTLDRGSVHRQPQL